MTDIAKQLRDEYDDTLARLVADLVDSGWQPHPDDKPLGLLVAVRVLALQRGTPEADADSAVHGKNPVAPAPWNEAAGHLLVDAAQTAGQWYSYVSDQLDGKRAAFDRSEPVEFVQLRRLPLLIPRLTDEEDEIACRSLIEYALSSIRARAMTLLNEEQPHAEIPADCPLCEAPRPAMRMKPMEWSSEQDDGRMASDGIAYCRSCKAEWSGPQLMVLLKMLEARQREAVSA